jgi:putative FmdB family regulatory protein
MPLYEYECESCKRRFERIQKFSDPPVDACPVCGAPVRKLPSSPAIQFKGSGFYITDYPKKSEVDGGKSDTGKTESSGSSDSSTASSSDSSSSTSSKDSTSKDSTSSSSKDSTSSPKNSSSKESSSTTTPASTPKSE